MHAVSSFPLEYQWMFNGRNLPGETRPLLQIQNAADEQAGRYEVVVRNASAMITSEPALLEVGPDLTRPELISARTLGHEAALVLLFSELVSRASAETASHY